MREVTGDLWDIRANAKVITTNGVVSKEGRNVMGRGTSYQAARRWKDLPTTLGQSIQATGNHVCSLGNYSFDPDREEHAGIAGVLPTRDTFEIVAFPTKEHWRHPSSMALIRQSARELVSLADHKKWKTVVMPRPGCGNGGLEWPDVKSILENILDNRFLVVNLDT